jgi:acetyl esterase
MREKLDQETRTLLEAMDAQGGPPLESMTVEEARRAIRALCDELGGPPEQVARVEDIGIPGPHGVIPARVYSPAGDGPRPGFVHLHGGGWVLCDLDCYDVNSRAIANRAGAVVVAVDYRLAPEHRYPAGVEDCFAATVWVAQNAALLGIDPCRIAVGGDSAGANLAAAVALRARDEGGPALALQVLAYGAFNIQSLDTSSYEEFAEGYFLTRAMAEWFQDQYIRRPEDRIDPYASPLLAKDLHGVAPALFITAECDVLRDEGEAYARRLEEAGVPVVSTLYPGTIHGFMSLAGVLPRHAHRAFDEIGAAVQALKGGGFSA